MEVRGGGCGRAAVGKHDGHEVFESGFWGYFIAFILTRVKKG